MKKTLSEALLSELGRYNQINKYISEQDIPAEDPAGDLPPLGGDVPPPPAPGDATLGGATPPPTEPVVEPGQPIDVTNDPDVEEITDDETTETGNEDSGTEELDITELVKSQKDIQSKQEEYMSSMMAKLDDLDQKLAQMDSIFEKINNLENSIEKYRPKSAEEKLHLRSLDSYPFNQKLTDFFEDKKGEMEQTGKNEYILKPEDVEDVDHREIRRTFDQGLAK